MSEPAPIAAAPEARRRRWLRPTLVTVGSVLSVILLVEGATLLRDEPPPDVRDLQPVLRPVVQGENAYDALAAATRSMDTSSWAKEEQLFSAMSRGEGWDVDKAARWLAANDQLWPALERAAALSASQGPVSGTLADSRPAMLPFIDLAQLASIRAWSLHRAGRHEDALRSLATALAVSERVGNCNSTVLMWAVGVVMDDFSRRTLEQLVPRGPLSTTTARSLIEDLGRTRPSGAALADALRQEALFFQHALRDIANDPERISDVFNRSATWSPVTLKPNETTRMHGEAMRALIASATADWGTPAATPPDLESIRGMDRAKWNPNNSMGRSFVQMTVPASAELIRRRTRAIAAVSATQAFIALRCYELEHGALPETLEEATQALGVPLPRDPFDGEPIRYSRELRGVWSVGANDFKLQATDSSPRDYQVFLRLPAPTSTTQDSARKPAEPQK